MERQAARRALISLEGAKWPGSAEYLRRAPDSDTDVNFQEGAEY